MGREPQAATAASERRQLEALAEVGGRLAGAGIDWWLFGGWAVDFHLGRVTRPHDDLDVAVWLHDVTQIDELLRADGWRHAPEPDEDGGTGYERDGVRLELTYLVRDEHGRPATPFSHGLGVWPEGAFGDDARELAGTRARLVGLPALLHDKSSPRDDPDEAAKDRADLDRLRTLAG
jgi:hypothetical protein